MSSEIPETSNPESERPPIDLLLETAKEYMTKGEFEDGYNELKKKVAEMGILVTEQDSVNPLDPKNRSLFRKASNNDQFDIEVVMYMPKLDGPMKIWNLFHEVNFALATRNSNGNADKLAKDIPNALDRDIELSESISDIYDNLKVQYLLVSRRNKNLFNGDKDYRESQVDRLLKKLE